MLGRKVVDEGSRCEKGPFRSHIANGVWAGRFSSWAGNGGVVCSLDVVGWPGPIPFQLCPSRGGVRCDVDITSVG